MRIKVDVSELKAFKKQLEAARDEVTREKSHEVNRLTDRHLARCVKNTAVGDSPDSPNLRDQWARSGVQNIGGETFAEVYNTADYAPFYEFGHRQTPGRRIFIELKPGASKYGRTAQQQKSGPYAGRWGIFIVLKSPRVKGSYVMTDSEAQAEKESDAAARRIAGKFEKRFS